MSIKITEENFKKVVLENPKVVLVDFYADWCNPCRMLSPILESIEKEYDDFVLAKINIDEQDSLAEMFRIASIPTLLVFKDGKVINSMVGLNKKDAILKLLGK